jgi:GNAT superfamily N-acetyltransferase
MTLTVRCADLGEASLVRDVMLAAYQEHEGALPIESGAHAETLEDVVADMRNGGAVLAEDDGVVGSARFVPEEEWLYVGRVAVLPTHRRRGVATAMMAFLEGTARELGLPSMRVGVRESLPDNVRLYESLGYKTVNVEPHPRGPDRVLWMAKAVAGAPR